MANIPLKHLVDAQQFTGDSDIQIIYKWFVCNNKEVEGIELLSKLSSSKVTKLQRILLNARTWIPTVPKVYESNPNKISKENGEKLDQIIQHHILEMPLSGKLLDWAKETIPTLNTPTIIFRPAIEWLKSEYGIEFKDKTI